MHLTPETLEGAYNFLKTTRPFNRWGLPAADDVSFSVIASTAKRGHFRPDNISHPEIAVSAACVSHTAPLIVTVAHEMCHLRAWIISRSMTHGVVWRRLANSVCKHHGFDPKEF